jgi:hypothetical protein
MSRRLEAYATYLFQLGCAVEIAHDAQPIPIPPPFLAGLVLSDGRSYCQVHEDYALFGLRVMSAFDEQQGAAAGWLPPLCREVSDAAS